jgi:hypothetical protein
MREDETQLFRSSQVRAQDCALPACFTRSDLPATVEGDGKAAFGDAGAAGSCWGQVDEGGRDAGQYGTGQVGAVTGGSLVRSWVSPLLVYYPPGSLGTALLGNDVRNV